MRHRRTCASISPLQGSWRHYGPPFQGLRSPLARCTPGFHEGAFVKALRRIPHFSFLCPSGHRVSLSGRSVTLPFFHPAKRRRALLASNPPRVSWCRWTGSAAFHCGASSFRSAAHASQTLREGVRQHHPSSRSGSSLVDAPNSFAHRSCQGPAQRSSIAGWSFEAFRAQALRTASIRAELSRAPHAHAPQRWVDHVERGSI